VRRHAPGYSSLAGFADPERADLDALAPLCAPGEPVYIAVYAGPVPPGWRVTYESTLFKMLWDGGPPEGAVADDAVTLGPQHVEQAVALAGLTHPGPFGPRTLELGEYLGVFDGDRLIAMAGERLYAGPLREVSGVCTHPDHQGRGLAGRLMRTLMRHQISRGETPVLHVARENATARRIYERMGFRYHREAVVRVFSRT
jgi:GNAT superfamily N-acetyltransferase